MILYLEAQKSLYQRFVERQERQNYFIGGFVVGVLLTLLLIVY